VPIPAHDQTLVTRGQRTFVNRLDPNVLACGPDGSGHEEYHCVGGIRFDLPCSREYIDALERAVVATPI
jgi:hypothetical protein